MFICVVFTGCEELFESKPDYITVSVQARAKAIIKYDDPETRTYVTTPNSGVTIRIEIVKAGGERAVFDRVTDDSGWTDTVFASFEVYKEQPIEVKARPQGFDAESYGYQLFTWDMMWRAAGQEFGGSCTQTANDVTIVTKWPEVLVG